MNFIGAAIRIKPTDIELIAEDLEVETAALKAVIAVETTGSGFDARSRPRALFERHFFYRHLLEQPAKLERAVNLGLAYPKWGTRPYPKGSDAVYQEITNACEIDEEAALLSTSWGLGQVMGENFRLAGCSSVQEMVEQAVASEHFQLAHMANYISATGLADELRDLDWAGFAKHYNGPAYLKNQYDVKLAKAYEVSNG
jgi:hypothetical protein